MNEISLFNTAPLIQLLCGVVILAAAPLSWVWMKNRHSQVTRRIRHLTLIVLFLTFDLVLFGAFTRLSDSGLGCPDWPGCYGHATPVGASAAIESAQEAMPSGPVTWKKSWIEMIHRYLAMLVGVLILTLAAFSWRTERSLWGWPSLTLLWVCVQGAFGAFTVTMKLFPLIVTMHLLGGMVLLVLLLVQLLRQRHAPAAGEQRDLPVGIYVLSCVGFVSVWMQTGLGAWVSSNYAVLACDTYPLCQNSWWPDMNMDKAFELWRGLGLDAQGQALPFQALTAIHMVHRWHALIPAVLLLVVALNWSRCGLVKQARLLVLLLFIQFATGISNAVLGWPLLAALMHTGTAAALLLLLTWVLTTSSPRHSRRIAATFNRHML